MLKGSSPSPASSTRKLSRAITKLRCMPLVHAGLPKVGRLALLLGSLNQRHCTAGGGRRGACLLQIGGVASAVRRWDNLLAEAREACQLLGCRHSVARQQCDLPIAHIAKKLEVIALTVGLSSARMRSQIPLRWRAAVAASLG